MLVFDTNVLIDAANADSEFHEPCRRILEEARRDPSPAFITWSICYEFLRVTTHPRVPQPRWRLRDSWMFIQTLLIRPGSPFSLLPTGTRQSSPRPYLSCRTYAATSSTTFTSRR